MSWMEHVIALRARLLRILAVFIAFMILSFVFVSRIYHYLTIPLQKLQIHLIVTSPGEIVIVYMTLASVCAIAVTVPFAAFELWSFIAPGLSHRERRFVLRLLPFVTLMFAGGVCFAWFFSFPTILTFLVHLTTQQGVGMYLRANSYFSFLLMICIPFGLAFELPIAVVVLTWIGIVSPKLLRRIRKYAYLAIVIIGVLISPPELVSHLSVTLPMIALYELSILLSVLMVRRRQQAQFAQET